MRAAAELRVPICLVMAVVLYAVMPHRATRVRAASQAESSVQRFQEAVFRSTRDDSVNGAQAVDLYWKASELSAAKSDDTSYRQALSQLYSSLAGDKIVRATLLDHTWRISQLPRELVIAQNQTFRNLLVVVQNGTDRPAEVAAGIRAAELKVGGQQHRRLEPGETDAFFLEFAASQLRRFSANLELQSEDRSANSPLLIEVRPAVSLHIRVLDAFGKPTPARVYVRAADGFSHVAATSFERVMWMTAEHYFYTSGTTDITLPAGATRIEVRKGFDYLPVVRELDLRPQQSDSIDIQLNWLRNMNAEGWYGGDDHIHGNYTGDQWSTPSDDLLDVEAEGLNVANMMVSNSVGGNVHDQRFFEGKPSSLSRDGTILYWNQEMRTWSYGHLVLLNLKRLVRPLYVGFPESPNWEDFPSNSSQARQTRQQGGIVIYAHPALRFEEFPGGSLAAESVVDVPLGLVDAFEVFCSHDEPSMELWYKFLNLGFKLGIAGGSDAFLNQEFAFLAGGERVYVYAGKHLDYESWINAFRRGRSFATVGPLLDFRINGAAPGSDPIITSRPATMTAEIDVVSAIPMLCAEIVENGQVLAQSSSPQPTHHLKWQGSLNLSRSAWLAARVWGPNNDRIANGPSRWSQRRSLDRVLLAHSSPVYVYVGRQPIFSAKDRDFCLRWLDSLTKTTEKNGKFANQARRSEVLDTFRSARKIYEHIGMTGEEAN